MTYLIKDGFIVNTNKIQPDIGNKWLTEIYKFLITLPEDYIEFEQCVKNLKFLIRVVKTYPKPQKLKKVLYRIIDEKINKIHIMYCVLKILKTLDYSKIESIESIEKIYFAHKKLQDFIKKNFSLNLEKYVQEEGHTITFYYDIYKFLKNNKLRDELKKKILLSYPNPNNWEKEVDILNSFK